MAPDGANQLAVPIEADGPPNHALQVVVGHERTEQLVDLMVRELGEKDDGYGSRFSDVAEADERDLQRILDFKRRPRSSRSTACSLVSSSRCPPGEAREPCTAGRLANVGTDFRPSHRK